MNLLKQKNKLTKEGKSLKQFDHNQHIQLLTYLALLEDQIFWENRKDYIKIVKSFIYKPIHFDQFISQFSELIGSNLGGSLLMRQNLEKEASGILIELNEIDLSVNSKSVGFSKVISNL